MTAAVIFAAGTFFFLRISRKALKNPGSHGFYRFFVFEGILALVAVNYSYWFTDRLAPLQLLSWLLLFLSLALVMQSVTLLRRRGGRGVRTEMPENLPFENTVQVVDRGIYGWIRHPMYTSLLLLAWGIYLKNVALATTALVLVVTLLIIIAALVEERENLRFFGARYENYRRRTRMFIPWII